MNNKNLNILIENFRAINYADINIDGITVIAGENGSGKSTISKLIYYMYKTISNYEELISENLNFQLKDILILIRISINDLFDKKSDKLMRLDLQEDLEIIYKEISSSQFDSKIFEKIIDLITRIQLLNKFDETDDRILVKLNYIFSDISKNKADQKLDLNTLFESVKEHILDIYKESLGYTKSRSVGIFKNKLIEVFKDNILPAKFTAYEFGQEIISLTKNHLSIPYIIQNAIYIDTPMMLGIDTYEENHWSDLNTEIKNINISSAKNIDISNVISNDILNGEAEYDDNFFNNRNYSFKRKDGEIFDLLDCATGVKSFSIIQLLLKNNVINSKTLLIIDEPESHLHPQWIVEYARLIVLLNKHLNVKFLIASHNPDMVSAIKFISENENTIHNLNYYLALKDDKYKYNFINLKDDIDPIFESFNIAFERMRLYGGSNDSERE